MTKGEHQVLSAVLVALAELKRQKVGPDDVSRQHRTAMLIDVMTSWAVEESVWLVRQAVGDEPLTDDAVADQVRDLIDEVGRAAADTLIRDALFRPERRRMR